MRRNFATRRTNARFGAFAVAGTVLLSVSACSISPQEIPTLQSRVGTGYDLTLHFSTVMSLPTDAHVMMDGLRVGEVKKVEVTDADVIVTAGIEKGTRIASDVSAVIRQDTLLGDTYIRLERPLQATGATDLAPGSSIPLQQTASPPQLEDTIAVLAYFVNGGSIQRIEDAMAGVNGVMPARDDVHRLAAVTAVDLQDLAQNTAQIDRTLDGFDQLATTIDSRSGTLNEILFNETALRLWYLTNEVLYGHVSIVVPSIGSVFEGGMWLVPMLEGLSGVVDSGRGVFDTAPQSIDKLTTFLRTTVLPFVQNPSVDIRSVESRQGDQLVADMQNLLRLLGAVK